MGWFRRVTVSIGLAVGVGASLTIASVGASGGFGAGAGTFTFNDARAFANFFNPVDFSSVNINVDRTTFLFKARPNGQLQSSVMTVLNIDQFASGATSPTYSTCLVIRDSDFVVSPDLQSTTLTVVNENTLCPGFLVPITGAAPTGQAGGGGGGGGGGVPPISVTASWTGNGVVGVSDSNGTFRCLTFVSITHDHSQGSTSSLVSATISNLGSFSGRPPVGAFGNVTVDTNVQNVAGKGILSPLCGGKGGG